MIDLHQWLTNPFDEPTIQLGELLVFSRDHRQRLLANNSGGIFSARIAATTAALAALDTALTNDQTALALDKSRKLAKQRFRETLPENFSRIYSLVTRHFGPDTPQFADCFPAGRTGFVKAADDRLKDLLQMLVTAVTAHQAQLGAQAVTDVKALLADWNAAHAPGESSSAAQMTTGSATAAARAGLQLELFKNLLTIGLNYPRVPELLDVYMQPSLLGDHPQSSFTSAPNAPGMCDPGETSAVAPPPTFE